MSGLDEREKAFEAKYRHDQEISFRIGNRRNRLFGLWAAELMGLTGAAASAYADEVVAAEFETVGHDDVLTKVAGDLARHGLETAEDQLRRRMDQLLSLSKEQVTAELSA